MNLVRLLSDLKCTIVLDLKKEFLSSSSLKEKEKELYENGFTVVENFLEPEKCDQLKEKIDNFLMSSNVSKSNPKVVSDNGAIVLYRSSQVKDEMVDEGMIDIFNIDSEFSELKDIRSRQSKLIDLEKILVNQVGSQNFNCYINKGIKRTRVNHADSLGIQQFKIFIYLTDVDEEGYGPYSYVKGSHRFSIQKYLNIFNNHLNGFPSTDMRVFNENDVVKFTAKKGTLIISDQNGFHRGIPQNREKERMILVHNISEQPVHGIK